MDYVATDQSLKHAGPGGGGNRTIIPRFSGCSRIASASGYAHRDAQAPRDCSNVEGEVVLAVGYAAGGPCHL